MKKKVQSRILGGLTERLATYLFGNATQRVKNFMEKHGEEQITSLTIARAPIQKAIATVMPANIAALPAVARAMPTASLT
jgi:hypothetical protein